MLKQLSPIPIDSSDLASEAEGDEGAYGVWRETDQCAAADVARSQPSPADVSFAPPWLVIQERGANLVPLRLITERIAYLTTKS